MGSSGQPSVDIGHRPDENQVSSTSPSRVSRSAVASGSLASASACGVGVNPALHRVGQRVGEGLLFRLGDIDRAPGRVPGGNLVAPPQLARDAPGLDVFQPVEIGLFPVFRHENRVALSHGGERVHGQRLGVHIPLVGEPGLDHHAGAVAVRHLMLVRLDGGDQSARLHGGQHGFARFLARQAVQAFKRLGEIVVLDHALQEGFVLAHQNARFRIQNVDQRQFVAGADLEIVEIVRRRDFHRARPLFRVGIFVGDDGDEAPDQRQHHFSSMQMRVALILGMHGYGRVAQQRFGTGGRHHDIIVGGTALLVGERIFEMVELALHRLRDNLDVGDGGQELGVPVHKALGLVDQPRAKKLDKSFEHRLRRSRVHGEPLARPVAGRAETFELVDNGAARFRLPLPNLFQKFLAAQRAAVGLLGGGEAALHHHLRGDAGMVRARLPQHVAAAHALEAAQNVLQGVVERMAHVQRAGDVRRRNDNGVGLGAGALTASGAKSADALPFRRDAGFDCGGIERLFHHLGEPVSISGVSRTKTERAG